MLEDKDIAAEALNRSLAILQEAARAGCQFDEWITIKKYVLLGLPPRMRRCFSTRCPKTKVQTLNEFESHLINCIERNFGYNIERPFKCN